MELFFPSYFPVLKYFDALMLTVVPFKLDSSLYNGPPEYFNREEAESKSLLIDVVESYMKFICPHYNHHPKPNGWGVIWKTNFYPFCNPTS